MRHGETLWNREGRLLGWTDLPLTAEGEAQARRLKGALPSLPAFSSDLLRARRTAELAGFSPPLPRASGDPLRSAGGGPLGDPGPPLQGGPPKVPGLPPPGGESLSAFQERVFRFLEGLKAPAVLFTHGGVVRAVLRALGEDGLVPPGSAVAVDWPRRVLVRLALDGEEATG